MEKKDREKELFFFPSKPRPKKKKTRRLRNRRHPRQFKVGGPHKTPIPEKKVKKEKKKLRGGISNQKKDTHITSPHRHDSEKLNFFRKRVEEISGKMSVGGVHLLFSPSLYLLLAFCVLLGQPRGAAGQPSRGELFSSNGGGGGSLQQQQLQPFGMMGSANNNNPAAAGAGGGGMLLPFPQGKTEKKKPLGSRDFGGGQIPHCVEGKLLLLQHVRPKETFKWETD